jgi:hypothetical protein
LYGFECLHQLLLDVLLFGPSQKERNDAGKADGALIGWVECHFHLFELGLSGAMAQSANEDGELRCWDGSFIFFIKDRKELLVVDELFF